MGSDAFVYVYEWACTWSSVILNGFFKESQLWVGAFCAYVTPSFPEGRASPMLFLLLIF